MKTIWKTMEKKWNTTEKDDVRRPPLRKFQPFRFRPCPNQSPAQAQPAGTELRCIHDDTNEGVSCTTTMYVTTACDCVTLCFPPLRISCLGYTLSLCATCSSSRRKELLYTQLQMQVLPGVFSDSYVFHVFTILSD